jgi:hypothetical protein
MAREKTATEQLMIIRCKSCGTDEEIEGLPCGKCPRCGHPRVEGANWGFGIVTSKPIERPELIEQIFRMSGLTEEEFEQRAADVLNKAFAV